MTTAEKFRRRLHAITNPEWHHVYLTQVYEISIADLDQKRINYRCLKNLLRSTYGYVIRIKNPDRAEEVLIRVINKINEMRNDYQITLQAYGYAMRQLSNLAVEAGIYSAYVEEAFGFHACRRYKKR